MEIGGKEIKGVIFDMDGVVLDSLRTWCDICAGYVRSKGLEPNLELVQVIFSMSIEQGIAYFKEKYDIEESGEELMKQLLNLIRDAYYYEVEAKPGAKELMERFRAEGIRMTAATASPRDLIERALERNGLLGYLEKIWTSTEVGSSKNDAEIYDLASEYMGTAPGETVVFEDALFALRTAKAAGYHTVGVYDAYGEPDRDGLRSEAEIYIHDLSEMTNS